MRRLSVPWLQVTVMYIFNFSMASPTAPIYPFLHLLLEPGPTLAQGVLNP